MIALHLKTKLVMANTVLVVAIVASLAVLHVSEVVHQRFSEAYNSSSAICNQAFAVARGALQAHLSSTKVNIRDPEQVAGTIGEVLQADSEFNFLLDSFITNSPTIYDVAVADARGQALLHTSSAFIGKVLPHREEFSSIVNGGIRKQLNVIYGPAQVYDVRLPLIRDGKPFGEVRVGVSTVLLKAQVLDKMRRALLLSGAAIFICMAISAGLSNLALWRWLRSAAA